MRRTMSVAVIGLALTLVSLPLGVLAATPEQANSPGPGSEMPWTRGVSNKNQDVAHEWFQKGNAFSEKTNFVDAAKAHREALKHWNHPTIHYYLALVLLNLDQPVEVYEHLEAAMQYGPKPLDEAQYKQAQLYKRLIEKQIVRLQLVSDTPGATVTLDGKIVLSAPGRYDTRVLPGHHTVVATREGYLDSDKSRTFVAGESVQFDFKFYTQTQLTRYERRWPTWVPWAVVGSGLAMVGSGGVFQLSTRHQYNLFDQKVTECGGCMLTPDLLKIRARGTQFRTLSWGGYALGGGALATGALLLYFNKPHIYQINSDQIETVSLTPLVGETNGLMATFSF